MVDLSVADGKLVLHVRGADKRWALKSSLKIPLGHVAAIRADPTIAHGWWHGVRMPGTNIPGVLTAGTFYQDGKRVFWDVNSLHLLAAIPSQPAQATRGWLAQPDPTEGE